MVWVVVLAVVLGLAAWVRLAPVDAARWHVDPAEAADPGQGGVQRRVAAEDPAAALAALAQVAEGWARTRPVAGSVAEGRVTYETRSALWGFPDYTTLSAGAGSVDVLARLRFGRSDLGVNGKRVDQWLDAAGLARD